MILSWLSISCSSSAWNSNIAFGEKSGNLKVHCVGALCPLWSNAFFQWASCKPTLEIGLSSWHWAFWNEIKKVLEQQKGYVYESVCVYAPVCPLPSYYICKVWFWNSSRLTTQTEWNKATVSKLETTATAERLPSMTCVYHPAREQSNNCSYSPTTTAASCTCPKCWVLSLLGQQNPEVAGCSNTWAL